MEIFRVFDWDGRSTGESFGGPLHIPLHLQGKGRHDVPALDGVLYCAMSDACAIVEAIQMFRGTLLSSADFRQPGGKIQRALAHLDVKGMTFPDLASADVLSAHGWVASDVVSMDRVLTQRIAATLYREGAAGFTWPSAVHPECRNITLFQGRVRNAITMKGTVIPLNADLPVVRRAAALLSIKIG